MERAEFDRWIEAHYAELVAVARRLTNTLEDAQDAVQAGVATALPHVPKIRAPWTFMVNAVRGAAANCRQSNARRARLKAAARAATKLTRPSALSLGWKRPAPRAD